MKRVLLIGVAAAVVSLAGISLVRGQGSPDRPPGVSAAAWVPISDKLGFVRLPPVPVAGMPRPSAMPRPVDPTVLLVKPPVEGYFMVKDASGWSRVSIAEPVIGPGGTG